LHVATAIIVIFATYLWGDWRNWRKYQAEILYVAMGNLLYNFLTANYFLWRLEADFISNHTLSEMLYTFIIFPGTVLLFLSNYPEDTWQKLFHYTKWIGIYILWEGVFLLTNRISYQYGWTYFYSFAFLFVMFPFIRLHQKHPLLTYGLSGIVAIIVIYLFDVPVHLPVEDR
jgi:hypothetical protein